jgi:quercetin dioxygenase-like cupin family protein
MNTIRIRSGWATALLAGAALAGALQSASAQAADPANASEPASAAAPHESITPAFAVPLANVPGKTMTALVVDYAPGGKSAPHRHGQAFVVGYVLAGAIRSRVDHGAEHVYRAGESWTEQPGAHHVVSENASATEPAKLLAIFVAATNDKQLVTFDRK